MLLDSELVSGIAYRVQLSSGVSLNSSYAVLPFWLYMFCENHQQ